jgi:hypothetical protein
VKKAEENKAEDARPKTPRRKEEKRRRRILAPRYCDESQEVEGKA